MERKKIVLTSNDRIYESLVFYEIDEEETLKIFGPIHREMDEDDNEPGPCLFWTYEYEKLKVLFVYHEALKQLECRANELNIPKIVETLNLNFPIAWRQDKEFPEVYEKRRETEQKK